MRLSEALENRTLLLYLLNIEVPFTIDKGYMKSNITLYMDEAFLDQEETNVRNFLETSMNPEKDRIARESLEIINELRLTIRLKKES